eukprot:PhM_4_TR9298/c0_g1_i1/m.41359
MFAPPTYEHNVATVTLTREEEEAATHLYYSEEYIGQDNIIMVFQKLNIPIDTPILSSLAEEYLGDNYYFSHSAFLELVLRVKRHQLTIDVNGVEEENAFVAMGGESEHRGTVSLDNLSRIFREFRLTHFGTFVESTDKDGGGTIDFDEFSMLFHNETDPVVRVLNSLAVSDPVTGSMCVDVSKLKKFCSTTGLVSEKILRRYVTEFSVGEPNLIFSTDFEVLAELCREEREAKGESTAETMTNVQKAAAYVRRQSVVARRLSQMRSADVADLGSTEQMGSMQGSDLMRSAMASLGLGNVLGIPRKPRKPKIGPGETPRYMQPLQRARRHVSPEAKSIRTPRTARPHTSPNAPLQSRPTTQPQPFAFAQAAHVHSFQSLYHYVRDSCKFPAAAQPQPMRPAPPPQAPKLSATQHQCDLVHWGAQDWTRHRFSRYTAAQTARQVVREREKPCPCCGCELRTLNVKHHKVDGVTAIVRLIQKVGRGGLARNSLHAAFVEEYQCT